MQSLDQNPDPREEKAFCDRIRARDRAAWDERVLEWHDGFLKTAKLSLGFTRKRTRTAEELVQEVWLYGWAHAPDFLGETKHTLKAWLNSVLFSKLSGEFRKKNPPQSSLDEPCPDNNGTPKDLLPDTAPDPTQEVQEQEISDLLRNLLQPVAAAVSTLTEEERTVLKHLYFEGSTLAETAAAMNLTIHQVRHREETALKKLARALGRALGEGPPAPA
jgi:RNA polymerase sigma factor (sigma-70 family)